MVFGLMIAATGAAMLGLVFLNRASIGVGLIAFGCLLAIFARLIQADNFQRKR